MAEDDEDPVFLWTCEIGGHTEESYEEDRPPEDDHWDVIDLARRFGSCDNHSFTEDGEPVEDDGGSISIVDVDRKHVRWTRGVRDERADAKDWEASEAHDDEIRQGGEGDSGKWS